MTTTHTRTHVHVEFADPYLYCLRCSGWVTGWHNPQQCGCGETGWQNLPCEHQAGATSACPSWSPVDGCTCRQQFGCVDHGEPPTRTETP